MQIMNNNLQTERLNIRWWRLKDMASLRKYASDKEVAKMAGWPPVTNWLKALDRVTIGYPKPWCFALVDRQSQKAIGSLSFMTKQEAHIEIKEDELEVGYWIAREFWGQGLVAEAAQRVFSEIFETTGIQRIYVVIESSNTQSLRVQTKLGFVYNRTEYMDLNCENRKTPYYIGVLDESDWRKCSL